MPKNFIALEKWVKECINYNEYNELKVTFIVKKDFP